MQKKINFYRLIVVMLLIFTQFSFSQISRDFKKEFRELTQNITDETAYNKVVRNYFGSLTTADLIKALPKVAELGDENFIATNLLTSINHKFDDINFRGLMITELEKPEIGEKYKRVLIDFIDKKIKNNSDQLKQIDSIFIKMAKDNSLSSRLRFIAASKVGLTNNLEQNKKVLKELVRSEEISVINGSAIAINRLIRTKGLESEVDGWVDEIITILNNNYENIDQLTQTIKVLGYAKTKKAKQYLLGLLNDHSSKNKELTGEVVAGLSNLADAEVFIRVFQVYGIYDHFNDYGSEIQLLNLVRNNKPVLDDLKQKNTILSKITYLQSVRLLRNEIVNQHLDRIKDLAGDLNIEIRLEAVKTIHFLLPHSEEEIFFKKMLKRETSEKVKSEIYSYIGKGQKE